MNLPFFIYCIVIAILIGAYQYRFLKPSRLHLLLPFLVLTLLVELFGYFLKYLDMSNSILYNVFIIVQVLFCTWFFSTSGISSSLRKLLNGGMVIYIFAILLHFILLTPTKFYTWLLLLGGLLVTLAGFFFLFSYFFLDNPRKENMLSPILPIAMGFVAYYSVLSISFSFFQQILDYNLQIAGESLHNFLPRMMSIILYLCFAYAFFICRKPVQA